MVRHWVGTHHQMRTGETVVVRDAKMARNNRVNLELDGGAGVFYLTGDELEKNLQDRGCNT